jgi:hypothetical protein
MDVIRVSVKPDTLDDENRKFEQQPLAEPVFLNSVPKCGTHLLRNIVRMFVPVEQQYKAQFIQHQFLQQHLAAFSDSKLSWGHLFFSDRSAVAVGRVRHIVLVRDPYDWVLAQARFFVSEQFSAGLDFLKEGSLSIEAILNMMIFGIPEKAPPLAATFTFNAVAWLGTGVTLVRYEDLVAALKALDEPAADDFFAGLLQACGIERPDDWRERVLIGSDREQSGTARENLTGIGVEFPAELPDLQKRMVDFAAPGLRSILGYQ